MLGCDCLWKRLGNYNQLVQHLWWNVKGLVVCCRELAQEYILKFCNARFLSCFRKFLQLKYFPPTGIGVITLYFIEKYLVQTNIKIQIQLSCLNRKRKKELHTNVVQIHYTLSHPEGCTRSMLCLCAEVNDTTNVFRKPWIEIKRLDFPLIRHLYIEILLHCCLLLQ